MSKSKNWIEIEGRIRLDLKISGNEVGVDKEVYTRGKVCTKQRDECVHQAARLDVKKMCTKEMRVCTRSDRRGEGVQVSVHRVERNEVRNRRSTGGSEVGGVHQATRWAQVGEVGCEKNVHGANKMEKGRRGVQVRVRGVDKVGREVEVEMESRSNKIEEVEVEVEIGSRLALRVEWAGVSGGGDKVKNKTRTTRDKKQRRIKNNVFFVNKEQVTSRRARVAKNQVGVDEEVYEREGVHQVARYEVCAQSSEVGVYQRDEVVCTKQRGVGEGVQDEQEMEVEMESRSNKIEEVEVEVEIRFRLALRGVGEGYIRGGEVDGVHQVSEMSVCTRVGRRGAPGVVVEEGGRG
ncbi:hypothetical protein PMAC_002793 [Pneumocystis sp. 'macacae']|nr:hypothetical protein PMAC_002793 [Pneumocystis sp. 'macacae']